MATAVDKYAALLNINLCLQLHRRPCAWSRAKQRVSESGAESEVCPQCFSGAA